MHPVSGRARMRTSVVTATTGTTLGSGLAGRGRSAPGAVSPRKALNCPIGRPSPRRSTTAHRRPRNHPAAAVAGVGELRNSYTPDSFAQMPPHPTPLNTAYANPTTSHTTLHAFAPTLHPTIGVSTGTHASARNPSATFFVRVTRTNNAACTINHAANVSVSASSMAASRVTAR